MTMWSMAPDPRGLSVNKEHLVACWKANKLQEYTAHGTLVREIYLAAGVTSQCDAVHLSTGHCVISQFTPLGLVSVVVRGV